MSNQTTKSIKVNIRQITIAALFAAVIFVLTRFTEIPVGADRIMFGIDSPFHHPTVEIQKVLTSGLDEKQQEDVFYNNAKKLLKL